MKRRELNEFLIETMQLQNELYDFCVECLKYLYKDETERAMILSDFEEGIDGMEWNGCIQGLSCLMHNHKRSMERIAENSKDTEKK